MLDHAKSSIELPRIILSDASPFLFVLNCRQHHLLHDLPGTTVSLPLSLCVCVSLSCARAVI